MIESLSEEKPGAIVIEGHVQGLSNTRSLGEMGIKVYVVDRNDCIARYSKFCKKFFKCPEYNKDDFAYFLMELAEKEDIRNWVLFPSNDHAVRTISIHKKRLERYFKIVTPGLEIIETIYDKALLLRLASRAGVSIPNTLYLNTTKDSIPSNLDFPVLIKGRQGLSFYKQMGKKAFLARNGDELNDNIKSIAAKVDIQQTIVQEIIPFDGSNKTISFTAFCINGKIKAFWMGQKLREHPIRFGTATFACSVYVEECLMLSEILMKALDYTGVCEVEYIKDPRDGYYKLIEINARTWLWVGLAKVCGIDYAKMIYNFAVDEITKYPENYKKGLKWINWYIDLPYSLFSILKKQLSLGDYLSSLKGPLVDALWYPKDIKPFFMFFLLIPQFKLTR